jgi:hypothetical protein
MTLFYIPFFESVRLNSLPGSGRSGSDKIDLTSLYPSWHGTFLAPSGYRPNGLGSYLSNKVEVGRFEGFENANTLEATDAKLAEIKNHPEKALLLPDQFERACQTRPPDRTIVISILFAFPYFGRAVHPESIRKPVCETILEKYKMEAPPASQNFGYGLWIAKSVEAPH